MPKIPTAIKLAIEPIVVAIVSLIFHFTLTDKTLAWIFTIVGGLMSVNNITVVYSIITEIDDMKKSMCLTSTLCSEYLKVSDPDYQSVRDEIMKDSISELQQLGSGVYNVSGNRYYKWLSEQLGQSRKTVHAVSSILEHMWLLDKRELAFYQDNRVASKKGVSIIRIFATSGKRLCDFCNRVVLNMCGDDNIQAFVIYTDGIVDPELRRIATTGMLLVDERILFLDIDPPIITSGQANKAPLKIKKYKECFDNLLLQSIPWEAEKQKYYATFRSENEKKYGSVDKLLEHIQTAPGNIDFLNDFMNWREAILYYLLPSKEENIDEKIKRMSDADRTLYKQVTAFDFESELFSIYQSSVRIGV